MKMFIKVLLPIMLVGFVQVHGAEEDDNWEKAYRTRGASQSKSSSSNRSNDSHNSDHTSSASSTTDVANMSDEELSEALLEAIRQERFDEVGSLIDAGADVNHIERGEGWYAMDVETPMLLAIKKQNPALVQQLLKAGAYVTLKYKDAYKQDHTIHHIGHAVQEGNLDIIKHLLQSPTLGIQSNFYLPGVGLNYQSEIINSPRPPLIIAAQNNRTDILQELLRLRGTNINHIDSDGSTALSQAVRAGSVDAIRELIAAGANVNQRNKQGHTVLQHVLRDISPMSEQYDETIEGLKELLRSPGITLGTSEWSKLANLTRQSDYHDAIGLTIEHDKELDNLVNQIYKRSLAHMDSHEAAQAAAGGGVPASSTLSDSSSFDEDFE